MRKSRGLIKGKFWVALAIFFKLNILIWGIHFVFTAFVVYAYPWSYLMRFLIGVACLVVLVPIFLYGLVLQTVIYFVCKSYHNEAIDRPALSKHLGEYERLYEPDEVQMEHV
nr:PREDICTED: uncharacterized protein LOC108217341 [Daucus carota subsp. sativus]